MTDAYFVRRGEYLNAHMLMDLLAGKTMEEVFQFKDRDTDAYHFGRAAHVATLEGVAEFNQRYIVGGPVNPTTGKTFKRNSQKFQEWATEQDRIGISLEDAALIQKMHWAVTNNKAAQTLLSRGEAEVTKRGTYSGYPCQARIDWISHHPYLVDLKTCQDVASFEPDTIKYRYLNQMAFYRELLSEYMPVYLIAVDKTEDPSCIVLRLHDRALRDAQEENEAKMVEVKEEFMMFRNELLARKKEEEVCLSVQS